MRGVRFFVCYLNEIAFSERYTEEKTNFSAFGHTHNSISNTEIIILLNLTFAIGFSSKLCVQFQNVYYIMSILYRWV